MNESITSIQNVEFLSNKKHNILKIDLLIQELYVYLLEINIINQAIENFIFHRLQNFDSSVGDWKCQTRTSIVLDLIKNQNLCSLNLKKKKKNLPQLIKKIENFIKNIKKLNHLERKTLTKKLINISLEELLNENDIFLKNSETINIISLFYLCSPLTIKHLPFIEKTLLTHKKINKMLISAKHKISLFTINYEKQLALAYCSKENQKILGQIANKGYSSMTAFFPSFKVIFEKMKQEKESFLEKKIIFCLCGGVISQTHNLYSATQNNFTKKHFNILSKKNTIMVIEGYQFNGSFQELKQLLKIPINNTLISKEFYKQCSCLSKTKQKIQKTNIEKIILAGFVQHPQFITGAEIDWKGLGLENSNLKKEFDHLKTIPGCSVEDMSTFCIRHVYASTIADVLKEQEEMETLLQAETK
ncbi:hypothetical protein KBB68_03375 [Candidatus Babeliales bacterium]|nr:hypothetical protein [Candidatus Babeliales bacterium]